MSSKRNYNEVDDGPESGFGSAESDSPPEAKNYRFDNGSSVDDIPITRTSGRRSIQPIKECENDEEIIESISSTITEVEEVENSDVDINQTDHAHEDGLKRPWDDNWPWEDKKDLPDATSRQLRIDSNLDEAQDGNQNVRISARRVHQRLKEERKESESSDQPLDEPSLVSNVVDAESKQKRTWEQWSYEDKAIFF